MPEFQPYSLPDGDQRRLWTNPAQGGEPPYPHGQEATHPSPSPAFVAVHKNVNLVSQFSDNRK